MRSYYISPIEKYSMLTQWFMPYDLRDNRFAVKAQRFLTVCLLAVASVPFFALLYHSLGYDKASVIVLAGGAGMLCAPIVLRTSGSLALACQVFVCALYGLKLALSIYLGGIESPTLPWLLLCPMIALFWGGTRFCIAWSIVIMLSLVGIFYLQTSGVPNSPLSIADQRLVQFVSILALFFFSVTIALLAKPNSIGSAWS